ncbi:LPXTG cell wall anchor domain-containing protein [Streptococcus suis]|uniref:LPXTG cell wall anchor domain-containing protein n=1 Tax=Streptococcus suis TaxID=1307 RepID=UPI001C9670E9|nr:LPXTG cell wall anchor domain-containing protein [Streptococcus suis]MBY4989985.1 LPXTG cell wall anchor domain-containing protein [Streptococcus suis]
MKRSSRKKRLAKWSKLGLSLAAVTVLGGLVEPEVADFVSPKVYAETYVNTSDQLIGVVIWHIAENTDGSSFRLNGDGGYMEVQPGQEIRSSAPNYDGYTLSHTTYAPPAWDGGDGILSFVYKQNKIAEQSVSTEKPAGDANSSDTSAVSQPAETSDVIPTDTSIAPLTDSPTGNDIVNSTIQLVDQDGQILQTIQQSGAEGSEVRFEFPVISGYRVGKAEGFDGWNYMKEGTFRLAANKIVKVYYDKAPSIDALIRPEQRVEYQKVFDEFHNTILKAFEVYKKELGVDDITYEANDLEKIFADSNLSVLHSELVLVQPLFAKPVGLVLTDQDIINAIGWAPEYWDYQISYHKEITQELEKAMANIAAAKATPTDKPAETPTEQPPQPITFPVRYVSVDYAADKGVVITGVLYETTATVEPGGTVIIENKTFDGYSLDTMEGPWKTEHSYEDVVAAGWSDGIDLRYSANTPTIDNTTDTANSSVDVAFQEASIRLYNLLMTASRLNPEDYTAESYNKYYDSHDEFGLYGTIISVLDEYKEVVNGNIKLEDRWDNGASPKAWLTVVYNANSTVLEQALAGLVAIQQETPSDSSSAGTDEGTTGKTSQTPTDKPVTPPAETPSVEPPATPPADSKPTETSPVTNQSTQNQPAQTGVLGSQTDKKPVSQPAQESQLAQLQVKQSTVKPASTSQSQTKTLPATGEVSSVLHLTGLGLLGLAGLVVKRRQRKSL